MEVLIALCIGMILDIILGDPHALPHPVVGIGRLIVLLEKGLRKVFPSTAKGELIAGGVLVVLVPCISFIIPYFSLFFIAKWHPAARIILEGIMCYQILAMKGLKKESMLVHHALEKDDISKARYFVSRIVGRDTKTLGRTGIIKATIETVAENTSDGVIAPLLFLAIGGAPLGFFYKAVNTLDSMVGYQNKDYLYFGRASAKLDDVLNFIPARISALFMIVASYLLGYDAKNGYRIYKRDNRKHSSPNSAQTEAVCAGALQIALSGDAYYYGKLVKKETIGDALCPVAAHHIRDVNKLMVMASLLCFAVCLLIRFLVYCLL